MTNTPSYDSKAKYYTISLERIVTSVFLIEHTLYSPDLVMVLTLKMKLLTWSLTSPGSWLKFPDRPNANLTPSPSSQCLGGAHWSESGFNSNV